MITRSLGKLEKLKLKGADSLGNKYHSLDSMWMSELDPKFVEMENMQEENKRVGSKENWYHGSV